MHYTIDDKLCVCTATKKCGKERKCELEKLGK